MNSDECVNPRNVDFDLVKKRVRKGFYLRTEVLSVIAEKMLKELILKE